MGRIELLWMEVNYCIARATFSALTLSIGDARRWLNRARAAMQEIEDHRV